jgi:general secretion pathway protein I
MRCAGFTLLEALVALAILSGVTASIMTLIGLGRRAQPGVDADLGGALHARSLLARLGRDLPLEAGTRSGTLDDGTAWTVLITPFWDDAAPQWQRAAMLQVHLRLRSGKPERSVDVVTLRRATP